jgi:hypothetical protein
MTRSFKQRLLWNAMQKAARQRPKESGFTSICVNGCLKRLVAEHTDCSSLSTTRRNDRVGQAFQPDGRQAGKPDLRWASPRLQFGGWLFIIAGRQVRVLRVRGPGQAPLKSRDVL